MPRPRRLKYDERPGGSRGEGGPARTPRYCVSRSSVIFFLRSSRKQRCRFMYALFLSSDDFNPVNITTRYSYNAETTNWRPAARASRGRGRVNFFRTKPVSRSLKLRFPIRFENKKIRKPHISHNRATAVSPNSCYPFAAIWSVTEAANFDKTCGNIVPEAYYNIFNRHLFLILYW